MNILTVLCEGIKDSSEVREKEREEREKGYFKYPNYDLVKYIQVFVNIRFLSLPVFVLTLVFFIHCLFPKFVARQSVIVQT